MLSKEKKLEVFDKLKSDFDVKVNVEKVNRIWVSIKDKDLIKICSWIKKQGFEHLSAISVTDWLEDGKFEITYHLWSYKQNILVTLKTKIDRNKPVIKSLVSIYDNNAQIHERELHELFGVKFDGNKNLNPLFLEDWNKMPPFRKDFDWREYVREEFYDKDNERERSYYV
jgi:NADH-quinone oxidoreductase subunit C